MMLYQSSQTHATQLPLSFAGYKKMTNTDEMAQTTLEQRIRKVLEDMPGPTRGKQVRLAKIADESKQLVSHWLKGVSKEIRYEAARRISEELGFRIDWLMRGKGPMKREEGEEVTEAAPTESMQLVYVTNEEMEVITNFRSTDEIGRAIIRAAAVRSKKD